MKILSTVLCLCIFCLVHAQQSPIPVFHSYDKPTPFFTEEGKVSFTLPIGHAPITYRENTPFRKTELYGNIDAFSSGLCVVSARPRYYWINPSGKVVKDFAQMYTGMSPFAEGFAVATYWNAGKLTYNFLNTQGVRLHPTGFKSANTFSDGLALCTTFDNEFVYIDKTGKTVINCFKGKQTENLEPGRFTNGLAPVKEKTGPFYRYYFVDRNGNIAIDLNKIFPDSTISHAGNFSDGIAAVAFSTETVEEWNLVFIDKKGNVKLSFPKVAGYKEFVDGLASVQTETLTNDNKIRRTFTLIDTLGNEVKLQSPKPYGEVVAISPTHIFVSVTDVTKEVYIFSRASKTLIHEAYGQLAGVSGQFVLTSIGLFDMRSLILLPDKVLWEYREPVVFKNLTDALENKDEVRYLQLYNPVSIPVLYSFSKLEDLELIRQEVSYFPPGINKLVNLERLKVSGFANLTELPMELAQLKKLYSLEVWDCPKLKNLEAVIEKCPSLMKVSTVNFSLNPDFIKKMRTLRPNLIIEGMSLESFPSRKVIPQPVKKN